MSRRTGDVLALATRARAHALFDELLDLVASRASRVADIYAQGDGERPTGCGRAKFLDVHRLARDGHDPGATVQGRARLMTADAWQRWCDAIPSRARKAAPPLAPCMSADTTIAAKLGIRRIA